MKKNELTKAVLTALLLASSSVMAESDYPAADFQPKVLYSDSSAQSHAESAKSAPVAKAAEPVEVDPNFPAANYQPKVLYSDANYKHSAAAPSAAGASKSSAVSVAAVEKESAAVSAEAPASSDNTTLLGLIALAAVGFFLFNKKSTVKTGGSVSAETYSAVSGATGVERYLEKQGINKTGVAKYLEKQTANPATGVAKYMAKQIIRDREAAAARATGVEKYLRDKG